MPEKFLESELTSDAGVDSLKLRVDSAQLEAFQNTLKWADARNMNAFITKLNGLQALNLRAEVLRKWQTNAVVVDQPQVAWVTIPVEISNAEVTAHNEAIRSLHRAVEEFNASREQFLKGFIARYLTPEPRRNDPVVGSRWPSRPAWDDMFSDAIRNRNKPTRNDAPDIRAVWARDAAWALASIAGMRKPSTGGVLDANGNLTGWSLNAANTAFEFAGTDRYVPNADKK